VPLSFFKEQCGPTFRYPHLSVICSGCTENLTEAGRNCGKNEACYLHVLQICLISGVCSVA
jgi:hypothetical protein